MCVLKAWLKYAKPKPLLRPGWQKRGKYSVERHQRNGIADERRIQGEMFMAIQRFQFSGTLLQKGLGNSIESCLPHKPLSRKGHITSWAKRQDVWPVVRKAIDEK
jgi:hypothetical protein